MHAVFGNNTGGSDLFISAGFHACSHAGEAERISFDELFLGP